MGVISGSGKTWELAAGNTSGLCTSQPGASASAVTSVLYVRLSRAALALQKVTAVEPDSKAGRVGGAGSAGRRGRG